MLGWHISVFRQQNDGTAPAAFGAGHGARLAVWQTGLWGLRWIDELVNEQKAIDLGGNGYPVEYTAMATHLLAPLREGPPQAKARWTSGAGDTLTSEWLGTTAKDLEAMDACRADEWLIIQAWDES